MSNAGNILEYNEIKKQLSIKQQEENLKNLKKLKSLPEFRRFLYLLLVNYCGYFETGIQKETTEILHDQGRRFVGQLIIDSLREVSSISIIEQLINEYSSWAISQEKIIKEKIKIKKGDKNE